jgi:hypothetical protein
MSNVHGAILRPLSIHETSFPVYARLSPGAGNVVAALFVDGPLEADRLRSALKVVQQENPVLRATHVRTSPVQATPSYAWAPSHLASEVQATCLAPETDLRETAHAALEQSLNLPFGVHHPLLRVRLLSQGERHAIILCVDHALLDGSSAVGILQRVMAQLTENEGPASQSAFPPALWEFMPPSLKAPTGALRCLDVLGLLARLQKQTDAGLAFGVEWPAPAAEHRCMVQVSALSESSSAGLARQGKASGAGVHGLVSAALVRALGDDIRSRKGQAFCETHASVSLPVVTTMDLRRRIDPPLPPDTLGCLSSGATHWVPAHLNQGMPDDATFLAMASQAVASLNTCIDANQHWKLLRIYQTFGVGLMPKIFLDASEKPMTMPLSVANLGRLEFPSGAGLQVSDFMMAPAFHPAGPSINAVCYTLDGRFVMNMAAASPQMSRATLQRFCQRTLAVLERHSAGA